MNTGKVSDLMRYLSDEWLQAADQALEGLQPIAASVVVGFVIEGSIDAEDRSYQLRLGPDRVGIDTGVADADVVMVLGRELAGDIAQGETSAQRAFLEGRLRLSGDVNLLLGHASIMASFDDRLASLRTRTEY